MNVNRAMLVILTVASVAGCGDNGKSQSDAAAARDAPVAKDTRSATEAAVHKDAPAAREASKGSVDANTLGCDPGLGATACGGAPAATWTYAVVCGNANPVPPSLAAMCPTISLTRVAYSVTGTLALGGDLSYTRASTTTVNVTVVVPATCISGLTCAAVEQFIPQMMAGGSGTCTTSGSDCACDVTWTYPMNVSGKYTVSGNQLTMTSTTDAGTPNTYYFCIDGNLLRMKGSDTNQPVPEQLGFVLTR